MFQSTQAKILALFAIIDLIVSFVAAVRTSSVVYAIISFLIGIVFMLIIIMDQDCVVIGGCNVWGWIKMVLGCIFLGISIIFALLIAIKGNKDVTTDKNDKKTEDAKKEHFKYIPFTTHP